MKRLSANAFLALLAFGTLMLCGSPKANADSLTLVSVGGNSAGGYDAYPYYFSVNGGAGSVPLMCLSYNNEIYFGETWQTNVYTGTTIPASYFTATGFNQTEVDEAAWLLNDANVNPANADADQLAAWSLFANNVPAGGGAQLALASTFVGDNPDDTSFYSKFKLYVPIADTQTEGGYPQTFIGEPGGGTTNVITVTPEPSSLLLLGSGLLGCAGTLYRRKIKA